MARPGPARRAANGRAVRAGRAETLCAERWAILPFTEAISLFVNCETQEEVDHYWNKLLDGGKQSQCGWLKDRYGLSWQIVPTVLLRYQQDPDRAKSARAMAAMLKMVRLDIAALKAAYEGR